ncbi:MAG: histidine phosphatase family protein [Treponema sp.]|jgi:uncharacterized phosphatase|nr:histidine phosphatase family protein [Treponema sp.]
MYICLFRHGETDWNNIGKLQGREDVPLNDQGIRQVKEAVKYLKNTDWKAIIASPLLRAKVSAEIISKETGNVKIYEEPDFTEKDYGQASGMTPDERRKNFPDGKWAGEEPQEKLQERTLNALSRYIKEYDGYNILIVSHGGVINSILAHLTGNETGTGENKLRNACITLLEKTADKIKIIFYNKTADELV